MANVLITGGSGLIGTRLTEMLLQRGHEVAHLGRHKSERAVKSFVWDVNKRFIEADTFNGIDTIIHLAGAGIADKRWTKSRKREILVSRTHSTDLLFTELKTRHHNVKALINASAIGYYGFDDNETIFTEESKPGKDFLATVVHQWEDSAEQFRNLPIRLVKIRVGIVLSEQGGALKEMAKPIKLYAGSPLGSGKQNISWIHIDDVCGIFIKGVEDHTMRGVYNATGPYVITNENLTQAIAKIIKRPLILPAVPSFVLKLLLGEMADLVLKGSKVSSQKIQAAGFQFKFKSLEAALEDLLHDNL